MCTGVLADGFCYWHSPSPEIRAACDAARRKGGRARKISLDAELLTPARSRQVAAAVVDGLLDGAIDAKQARAVFYGLRTEQQLREGSEIAREVEQLRAEVVTLKEKGGL